MTRANLFERFSKKYDRITESGCWIWTADCIWNGYGRIRYLGKNILAHRVSWIIHNGEIKDGLLVLHRCDVRPCVNPAHLFLGTNLENMRDMAAKGRTSVRVGVANNRAKLSEDNVLDIRKSQRSQSQIAADFGITQANVSCIIRRKTWSHL